MNFEHISETPHLAHYGVKGMKWGQRRKKALATRQSRMPAKKRPTKKELERKRKRNKKILIGAAAAFTVLSYYKGEQLGQQQYTGKVVRNKATRPIQESNRNARKLMDQLNKADRMEQSRIDGAAKVAQMIRDMGGEVL